jgi:dTDP-4-amino-4,6-dideoxygalactose transaminase
VLSFHATKVFNTFEGGAIICPDARTKQRIDYLKNFGFANEVTVMAPGINGKMSEFQAALGMLQLQYIDKAIDRRKAIQSQYREALDQVQGIELLPESPEVNGNASYFPVLVGDEYPLERDALYEKFRENDIYVRRYFYPLISSMPMYRGGDSAKAGNLPVATRISQQVLCLPIYPELSDEDVLRVIALIQNGAETIS